MRVELLGEAPQQVAHLVCHVAQGDGVAQVGAGSDAARRALVPAVAPGTVDSLGQLAEKEAAGHLLVELEEGLVLLQEVPQAGAGLQQQAHKLRLVADEGGEHGAVEFAGLGAKKLDLSRFLC